MGARCGASEAQKEEVQKAERVEQRLRGGIFASSRLVILRPVAGFRYHNAGQYNNTTEIKEICSKAMSGVS